MAVEYFCAYHSYLDSMELLNDGERGRLFTACLEYSKTGVAPRLTGNERFVFSTIRGQIDRDNEKYKSKCKKLSENASSRYKHEESANGCKSTEEMQMDAKTAKEKEKEKEKEKKKNSIHPTDVCAELPSSPPPAAVLPLVDGSDFPIARETVDELSGLYPAVDVDQQLRNMRGWLLANPKNRKTKAGIMRFVNSWLAREQNRTRPQNQQQFQGGTKAKELDKFYGMAADWVSSREVTG